MRALITGVSGQDGSFLSESLLKDGWEVFGMVRRTSYQSAPARIENLLGAESSFKLFAGDLGDDSGLRRNIQEIKPDVIYHLAGQSDVGLSFSIPETTLFEVANATLSLLEICRDLKDSPNVLLVGSSEVFGSPLESPQSETTPHAPTSPYGCAKSCALNLGRVYRCSFGVPVSSVIPYNHESIRRGENFVTRKITMAAARIANGADEILQLGNLDGERDWGYAPEYVEGMRKIVEHGKPDDYILATGVATSVRDFAKRAFEVCGLSLEFQGEGLEEIGLDQKTGKQVIEVNPDLFRPADPVRLVGDASKAKRDLGWVPSIVGKDVAERMVLGEIAISEGRAPVI